MRSTRAIIAVLFVTLVVAATPTGQEPTTVSLRDDPGVESALRLVGSWLDAERAYKQVPGLSVAIVHDQEIVWSHGFGYADRERRVKATAKTLYSICSISKLFTSIGVMQLRDQGQLTLGDSPSRHLPWFNIEQTYPDRAPVTIRGMLTHSSGLPRESDFPYWSGPDFEFPTREQIMERVGQQQTLYPGDTYFQYSNLGLTLAGMIVAQVSGDPYDAYVTKNILEPLGLPDTKPDLTRALWGDRLATGYGAVQRDGTRAKLPFFQARGIVPAAGFSSTVDDLAAFASWQFRLLENGGEDILHANTLREMHRVHWLDPDWETAWGLGFSVARDGDTTFVGHGGSCPGYQTHLRLQTDSKIATIVMANASGVDVGQYTARAFQIVEPAISEALKPDNRRKPLAPSLDKYTGTYSAQPWAGEIAVLHWKNSLAMLSLPTDDPVEGLQALRQTGAHQFHRVRDDGELGEDVVFEMDASGTVTGFRRNSNVRPKID